jgi:hypothetical protein
MVNLSISNDFGEKNMATEVLTPSDIDQLLTAINGGKTPEHYNNLMLEEFLRKRLDQYFLNVSVDFDKIEKETQEFINAVTKDISYNELISQIENMKIRIQGFSIIICENGECIKIENNISKNECRIYLRHRNISLRIKNIGFSYGYNDITAPKALCFLKEFPAIEKEHNELSNNLEKQIKLDNFAANSIITLLENLCSTLDLEGHWTVCAEHIVFSVPVKHDTNLAIQIPFVNFMDTIEKIPKTIEIYKRAQDECGLKASLEFNQVADIIG